MAIKDVGDLITVQMPHAENVKRMLGWYESYCIRELLTVKFIRRQTSPLFMAPHVGLHARILSFKATVGDRMIHCRCVAYYWHYMNLRVVYRQSAIYGL